MQVAFVDREGEAPPMIMTRGSDLYPRLLACDTWREESFNKVVELPKPADLEKYAYYLLDKPGLWLTHYIGNTNVLVS